VRLTVVNGNQVLVVAAPASLPGPYYAVKELPLPTLPTATLPARAPTLAPRTPAAAAAGTASAGASTATAAVQNSRALPADRPVSSTVPALVLSVVLPLVLVAGVRHRAARTPSSLGASSGPHLTSRRIYLRICFVSPEYALHPLTADRHLHGRCGQMACCSRP